MPSGARENPRQIADSRRILEQSQVSTVPYDVEVGGLSFVVEPGVFSPKYFDSTRLFSPRIQVRAGERFLEVGCGTGVTSVLVALRGAQRVVAVDINASAVENAKTNAHRHGVENVMSVKQSDVFSNIGDELFDTIYWNLPFIYIDRDYTYRSVLERALFDPGYEYTRRLLREGRSHLATGGRVLVGFADFGDLTLLESIAAEFCWGIKELSRDPGTEGRPVTFSLYELTPR